MACPTGLGGLGKKEKALEVERSLHGQAHVSLGSGLPSLQVVGGEGSGERGRQLCPGGGQKDVVWGRAGGDP